MITIHWRMPGDQAQLDVECEHTGIVWDTLVKLNQIFNHTVCGKCGSANIQMITRVSGEKKNRYHEWKCLEENCGAALPIHQHDPEKGLKGLYAKWDDQWTIWKPEESASGPPI